MINFRQQENVLFIDTETIGSFYDPDKSHIMPFDLSVNVYNIRTGKVVYKKCYLVRKFFNNKYAMWGTFSAGKYPKYQEALKSSKDYFIGSVREIGAKLERLIAKYNIKYFVAHNGGFDQQAIDNLFNHFEIANPIKQLDYVDTLAFSRLVITNSKHYIKFCLANKDILNSAKESKFITNSGRVRETAEAIGCFLRGNPDWKEEHTGLEDIAEEIKILEHCLKKRSRIEANFKPSWRDLPVVAGQ